MAEDAGSVLEGYFIDFQLGCNVFFFFQTQTNELCVLKSPMIFFYEPTSFPSVYQGLLHLLPREPFTYGFWCFHLASWWHSQMLGMRWEDHL